MKWANRDAAAPWSFGEVELGESPSLDAFRRYLKLVVAHGRD